MIADGDLLRVKEGRQAGLVVVGVTWSVRFCVIVGALEHDDDVILDWEKETPYRREYGA